MHCFILLITPCKEDVVALLVKCALNLLIYCFFFQLSMLAKDTASLIYIDNIALPMVDFTLCLRAQSSHAAIVLI